MSVSYRIMGQRETSFSSKSKVEMKSIFYELRGCDCEADKPVCFQVCARRKDCRCFILCAPSCITVSWGPMHRSFFEAPVITLSPLLPLLLHSPVPSSFPCFPRHHHYSSLPLRPLPPTVPSKSSPYLLILHVHVHVHPTSPSSLVLIGLICLVPSCFPFQPPPPPPPLL